MVKTGWARGLAQEAPPFSYHEHMCAEGPLAVCAPPHSLQRSLQARDCHNLPHHKGTGEAWRVICQCSQSIGSAGDASEPFFPPPCKPRREDRTGQGQRALCAPVCGAAVWLGSFQALGHNADCDRVLPLRRDPREQEGAHVPQNQEGVIWPVDTVSFLQ